MVDTTDRVVLRPLASPLPLGFLGLLIATTSFAVLQLGWVAPSQGHTIALAVLVSTVPLQLIACVVGFLAHDPAAATGMGLLAGGWGSAGLATVISPPGSTSGGLGVVLVCVGLSLLVPAAAARAKLVACAVVTISAVRFAVTGVAQLRGSEHWLHLAGWVGLALAVVSAYAALALELEENPAAPPLPVGRSGPTAAEVPSAYADQPGVRPTL